MRTEWVRRETDNRRENGCPSRGTDSSRTLTFGDKGHESPMYLFTYSSDKTKEVGFSKTKHSREQFVSPVVVKESKRD